MAGKNEKYRKDVVELLCDARRQLLYVLTAVANAIQERIGEDVVLCPREGDSSLEAYTFDVNLGGSITHFIFFGVPEGDPPDAKELLRVTLDVAHELGHLVLEGDPGHLPNRVGIPKHLLDDAIEIECDWFAVCVLQMYGFLFPT